MSATRTRRSVTALLALLLLVGGGLWWAGRSHTPPAAGSPGPSTAAERAIPALEPPTNEPAREARAAIEVLDQDLEAEVTFREPSAPVTGRLVDSRTAEPVAFLEFAIDDGESVRFGAVDTDESEPLETDATGRFRSQRAYRAGHLSLKLTEREGGVLVSRSLQSVGLDFDPRQPDAGDLPVLVGPTYRLLLDLPPGVEVDGLVAELGSAGPEENPFLTAPRKASVRRGDPPWVRFPRSEFDVEPTPPWSLGVGTDGGEWSGSAAVESLVGIYPRPVSIRLEARGGLRGAFVADDGKPGSVYLQLLDADGEPVARSFFTDTYALEGLPGGDYRIVAESRSHVAPEARVSIAAGVTTELDLELERRAPVGDVAGVVRSEAGKFYRDLDVRLFVVDKGHLNWRAEVVWEDDRGTFVFPNMPAGEYQLEVSVHGARVEPAELVVSPPIDTLELLIRDDPASFTKYEIGAVDAETGKRIQGPRVHVRAAPDGDPVRQRTTGWSLRLHDDLPGERREWQLECEGYERAWGDEASFVEPADEENVKHLVVPLRRGWSGRVLVRAADGRRLAGVEVAFDETPPALTDADGFAVVRAPARPQRVRVHKDGWRLAGGDVDAATGAFADSGLEIVVELAADE